MVPSESAQTPYQTMNPTTTNQLALLANDQVRFRTLSRQIMHSEDLLADLDTSMRRLIDYLPVVECARRELCARREDSVAELRDLVLELLGMHDVPLHNERDFRDNGIGSDMAAGPYELDGTSSSGRGVVEPEATAEGACVEETVTAKLEDPTAVRTTRASPASGRSSSCTIERLKRVDSAFPTAGLREAAPLVVDSCPTDHMATACDLNNGYAGRHFASPSFVPLHAGGRHSDYVSPVHSRSPGPSKKPRSTSRVPESIKRLRGTVKPPFFRPSGGAVY
ncbi:hypothetical protein LTR73_007803 [Friedmanniomyces endolithicus]|nr:hypothetical protein LTR73_007803 [Friedmanniomyces endolithicus]